MKKLVPKKDMVLKREFDERTQMILKGIIDSYIHSSEPVGSRTLSKALDIDLSPATIRNIMADLSEMGYLTQTHTSGGRIPTDKAYRFYVDSLAVANELPLAIQNKLQELSKQGAEQVERMLVNTTRMLADLTQFVCIVSAPKAEVSVLQRIEFIKVNAHKVLVILITKSGIVRNKIIDSTEDLSQKFLNSIAEFLNEQFHNASLLEIRTKILDSMVEDKERYDKLLAQAVRLGKKAFEIEELPNLYIDGQMNLVFNNKFSSQDSVRTLVTAFEQKTKIVDILDNTLDAEGIQIFIGIENKFDELHECSLITKSYGYDNHLLGMIGVLGPTCMDYSKIIPVVDYTAKLLSQTISDRSHEV